MSKLSPDRRKPCGATKLTNPKTVGGCTQQYQNTNSVVLVRKNTTKMRNYADPTSEGFQYWIDPYPIAEQRTAPDCSPYNAGGCPGNPCYQCGDFETVWNVPCWPKTDEEVTADCFDNAISFSVGNFHNCYTQSNETASYTKCRNIGYKNVYASKTWPGRYSYNSRMHQSADYFDWCCGCSYHNADSTADQTKYLSLFASVEIAAHTDYFCPHCCDAPGEDPCGTYQCPDGFGDWITVTDTCCTYTANGDNDWSANAYSTCNMDVYGNYSGNCSSGSSVPGSYPQCNGSTVTPTAEDIASSKEWWAGEAFGMLSEANSTINTIFAVWCSWLENRGTPDVITGDGTSWHIEFHTSYDCYDQCGNVTGTYSYANLTMDISVGGTLHIVTMALKPPGFNVGHCASDGYCPTPATTMDVVYSYGATTYSRTLTVTGIGSWSFSDTYTEIVTGQLSSPYTSTDVYNEIVNLLGHWDMGDDKQYPWREDSSVSIGPWVHHEEEGGQPFVPICTGSYLYSGNVIGGPGPLGIDRVWDQSHANYCVCDSLVQPGCLAFYIKDYGAWSTNIAVPRATAWLNTYQANNIPQGAFVGSNFFWTFPSTCNSNGPSKVTDDVLWACKYAEAIFPKQSFNYARPCGADTLMISQSTNRCIKSITDLSITFEDTWGYTIPFQTDDKVWVCGTSDLDGLWKATRDSDYQITLQDPRLASASYFPSTPISDCGTGMVSLLRWPGLQSKICGRVDITAATQEAPIKITFMEPQYLLTGDTIIISDAKGMTYLNKAWVVTVIDSSTVTLDGSDGTDKPSYEGYGMARSPFSADWKWNSTEGVNDFSILKWKFNYRDVAEYNRAKGTVEWNAGLFQCDWVSPCPGPSVPEEPRANQKYCFDQTIETFTCTTDCLPFNACQTVVAYFSPNSESFDKSTSVVGSRNYGFVNPGMDTTYGTLWQGIPKQSMNDPLYQGSPCPCSQVTNEETMVTTYECNCSMREDDGNCNADQIEPCIKYYAATPQYEARCEVPEGAPQLPEGAYVGCLKQTDFNGPDCPRGNVCYPPWAPNDFPWSEGCNAYMVYPWATPWTTLVAKEGCVCGGGRFSGDYLNNGIYCVEEVVSPP